MLFPPEYEPHGVQMLYEGVPVDLTPEQEEVCYLPCVGKRSGAPDRDVLEGSFSRAAI